MRERYTRTNLFDVIRESGWSKRYVARRMGYHWSYLYKVVNGDREITPEFVERACALFKLPPSALFFDPRPVPQADDAAPVAEREPVAV